MKSIAWGIVCVAMLGNYSARSSAAVSVPFTEDFGADAANWKNSASGNLTWSNTGGPDGGSYASASQVFQGQAVSMGLTMFRGQDAFNASNDAFVGNWLTTGVGRLTAYVRQNTSQPLSFFARIATSLNFPGVTVQLPTVVQPSTWTKLDFDLSPSNPFVIPEGGPGTYEAVLGSVGNVQIGVGGLSGFTSDPTPYKFDLDKVSIGVPEPASGVLLVLGAIGGWMLWRRRQG